jgi:hypothetical protein
MQKSVAELAGETTKAIGALAREIDAQGKSSKKVCACVFVCVCQSISIVPLRRRRDERPAHEHARLAEGVR